MKLMARIMFFTPFRFQGDEGKYQIVDDVDDGGMRIEYKCYE